MARADELDARLRRVEDIAALSYLEKYGLSFQSALPAHAGDIRRMRAVCAAHVLAILREREEPAVETRAG